MKTLIAYYSRTGTTKQVAELIAKELNADIEEIIDLKNRKGVLGYIKSGKDAALKKLTEIEYKKNPKEYDLVIIGTPVWAGNMTPAIRTYLTKNKLEKGVGLFVTAGSSSFEKTFNAIKELVPKATVKAELGLITKDVKEGAQEKIKEFVGKIK